MPFEQSHDIRFFTFNNLSHAGVTHAVFTRNGGLSPKPWASLNVGGTVGDKPERVYANRVRSFLAIDKNPSSIFDVWQVHGSEVVCAANPRPPNLPHLKADTILTDNPKVTLFMRFADCVPVLLFDPTQRVVGLVHAGWQGTIRGALIAAIDRMVKNYGCLSENILAAIGPSIGPDHYQVGSDVAEQVKKVFGGKANGILLRRNGTYHFDLWRANCLLLERSGVQKIEVSEICTACHLEDWYSYRAEKGRTGRFGAVIALSNSS